jgi:hypothetical protein
MQRLSDFLEEHAAAVVIVGCLVVVGGYLMLTGVLRPGAPNGDAQSRPTPTASLTATLSGSPGAAGATVTSSQQGGGKAGSGQTVRAYRGPHNRIIRETVRELVPGTAVTAIQTVVAAAPARGGHTARETVLVTTRETVVGPGTTVTVEVPVTQTVPGPTTTKTVTVPGPDLPTTVTVTASP